jgi:hypothetical protein
MFANTHWGICALVFFICIDYPFFYRGIPPPGEELKAAGLIDYSSLFGEHCICPQRSQMQFGTKDRCSTDRYLSI